jgi:hypothetical protein
MSQRSAIELEHDQDVHWPRHDPARNVTAVSEDHGQEYGAASESQGQGFGIGE